MANALETFLKRRAAQLRELKTHIDGLIEAQEGMNTGILDAQDTELRAE